MSKLDELIFRLCPNGLPQEYLGKYISKVSETNTKKKFQKVKSVVSTGILIDPSDYFDKEITSADTSNYKVVRPGMFVYNPARINIGSIAYSTESEPIIISPMYVVFSVNNLLLLNSYLNAFIRSTLGKNQILSKVESGARFRFPYDSLASIKIQVPPIEIQQEIVRILDIFTTLEAELELEMETRKKQYGFYRDRLLNFEYDENCDSYRLGDIVEFRNGKGHENCIDNEGKYTVINSKFISTSGLVKKYSRFQLTPLFINDITIVMSDLPNGRALAKCFIVDENDKYTLNQRIGAIKIIDRNRFDPKFLLYKLNRNPQLLRYDNGVDQTNLKKNDILDIELSMPKIDMQKNIVEVLDSFDTLVNNMSIGLPAEIVARRKQYEYYRNKLLSFKEVSHESI